MLERAVTGAARRFGVPGVAVGVYAAGSEHYVFHGVTSAVNPLPVDAGTLFQAGSITKTVTATAIMRLAEAGQVDIDAPVRRYIPELRLKDRSAAERVTVLQLLNHTAGFAGDFFWPGADGEDALARHVERLAAAGQLAAPGTRASYNNAAFGLTGRLIEKVTRKSYEAAARALALAPIGLSDSFFLPAEVMTRRFSVGHLAGDGEPVVAPGWAVPRRAVPAGGLITTAGDLIRYARFHLGDGTCNGVRVLSRESVERMRQPTVPLDGGYLGDYAGIGWLLRDVGGVRLAGHEGVTSGQRATLQLVPARDFAIVVLTNSELGGRLCREVLRWALQAYLDVEVPVVHPVSLAWSELGPYAGDYESPQLKLRVTACGDRLVVAPSVKEEALEEIPAAVREAASAAGAGPLGNLPPVAIKLVTADRYVIVDGPDEGAAGTFARDAGGQVRGINLEGKEYDRPHSGPFPGQPGMRPDSLYDLPVIDDPRLSPDATLLAFTVTQADRAAADYRSAIWIVPAGEPGEPRQLTAGMRRDTSPRWSPDGRRLLFLSTRDGGAPQLYVIAVDGGEAARITDVPGGADSPCWSPDGTRIAFTSVVSDARYDEPGDRQPPRRITRFGWRSDDAGWTCDRFSQLFVTDARPASTPVQLTDGPFHDTSPAWSPDGTRLAFVSAREPGADRSRGNHLYLVPPWGGEVARLTSGQHHHGAPAWSPDGDQIACRYRADVDSWPRNGQIAVIDARTGDARLLTGQMDVNCAPMNEQREPVWDGESVVFPAELHGNTYLFRAPADGSRGPEAILGGDRVVSAHDLRAGTLIHAEHSAAVPAELFQGDRRLTYLTQRFRDDVELCPAERFQAVSVDGSAVDAWMIRPAGFQPGVRYPVLLFIHGGPFYQYRDGFLDEFQVAAGAGYAVVYSNPRGSSGYGEAWARAIAGPRGLLDPDTRPDFQDLMAVMDEALARFDFCDAERTGVLGGSYGGFMTAWIIGHTDRFRAACTERAVIDQLSQLGTSDLAGPWGDEDWGGQPYADLSPILAHSPISYVRAMHTPVLIVHAEHDLRASIGQAEELFTALRALRREVEFVRFPSGNHNLSRKGPPHYRVSRFDIILDWFDRHLKTPGA
jgi:dipeptidyl aminopeptidase/acylaminoacyl peptidase/CubicO group peptidase (beta-lactamase class C family)